MTATDPNERMAVLLNWENTGQRVNMVMGEGGSLLWAIHTEEKYEESLGAPDFSQWDRFPELQEYALTLDDIDSIEVFNEIWKRLPKVTITGRTVFSITPSIFRDSLLAVVGEEAEVGS